LPSELIEREAAPQ